MIDILFSAVLPIFALMAIGFGLGRMGVFDPATASAINRFVFLISVPALIFGLLARSHFEQFNWLALAAFATIELVMYGTGFLVARTVFKREIRESLLIGLATAFANHLLFVLPIAMTLFGESAATPIVAIATVDALFIYGGTLLLIDALSETDASITRVLTGCGKTDVFDQPFLATLDFNHYEGDFLSEAGRSSRLCSAECGWKARKRHTLPVAVTPAAAGCAFGSGCRPPR